MRCINRLYSKRWWSAGLLGAVAIVTASGSAIDWQPMAAQGLRLLEGTEALGMPFSESEQNQLNHLLNSPENGLVPLQQILDRYALLELQIEDQGNLKIQPGAAQPQLMEKGWTQFLIKIRNPAESSAVLNVNSPEGGRWAGSSMEQVERRWMDVALYQNQPFRPELSGLGLEYRVIQIYSDVSGSRSAQLNFHLGKGDAMRHGSVKLDFQSDPAHEVVFRVQDENGEPTTGMFLIRDQRGRVYPSQAKRLAPDFAFHPQVYRTDGESVRLPEGKYSVEFSRGPESLAEHREIEVTCGNNEFHFQSQRWIDPSLMGWWSGDHHIHAAGCAHYTNPTEGVHAPDMFRHCVGEDLKIGANLTWGPSFDYQKQFFTGKVDPVSVYPYLLRYDVEVSGFGSHNSGHLCLLRLKEQIYPGGDSKHHWPTLCLNTLKWAKRQGGVTGPAHSGWGLSVETEDLPNFVIPPFDGIGANEYIVDVTHEVPGPDGKLVRAVDFISTVDTPYVWELNIWYHTLNVGFKTRISGETDFPCIYGERVGLGRSYVQLDGELDYDDWCEGVRQGRNYVGDGRSHLIDFQIEDVAMGENGSELKLDQPRDVKVKVLAAALLDEEPDESIRSRPYSHQPYWHVERARAGKTRQVPVELIVNGYPVATRLIEADGALQELTFDLPIEKSSWVAVRILPSSHTNPIFVKVGGRPIRASKASAEWCLTSVEKCWSQKKRFIHPSEMQDAIAAYHHARQVYQQRILECVE